MSKIEILCTLLKAAVNNRSREILVKNMLDQPHKFCCRFFVKAKKCSDCLTFYAFQQD